MLGHRLGVTVLIPLQVLVLFFLDCLAQNLRSARSLLDKTRDSKVPNLRVISVFGPVVQR